MAVLEKNVPESRMPRRFASNGEPLAGAFFWLSAFTWFIVPGQRIGFLFSGLFLWQKSRVFSRWWGC